MILIPALWRQKQVDFSVEGQDDIVSEFQQSQGYTQRNPISRKQNKLYLNKMTLTGICRLLLNGMSILTLS